MAPASSLAAAAMLTALALSALAGCGGSGEGSPGILRAVDMHGSRLSDR